MAGEGTAGVRLGEASAKDFVLELVSSERTLDEHRRELADARLVALGELLETIPRLVRNRDFNC
jgi:hypothetical protein